MVMAKPSATLISSECLTKIRGKIPTIVVMNPLIRRGANDESMPLKTETIIESSIKIPLKISVSPRYLDISLMFILFS